MYDIQIIVQFIQYSFIHKSVTTLHFHFHFISLTLPSLIHTPIISHLSNQIPPYFPLSFSHPYNTFFFKSKLWVLVSYCK